MFVKQAVAACLAVCVIALGVTVFSNPYSAVISLCLGWATWIGTIFYLQAVPSFLSKTHLWVLMTQLVTLAILAPWFGWTNRTVPAWFGNFFFVFYLVMPICFEVIRNQLVKRNHGKGG